MSSTLNRRKFIKLTGIAATSLSLMSMKNLPFFTDKNNKRFIIDADSANEIDDLLALFSLIAHPGIKVIGLCASHWAAGSSIDPSSMQQSYEMNGQVVKSLAKYNIPLLKGIEKKLTSTTTPLISEAGEFIIQKAKSLTDRQVLRIISLGIPTNLASALILAPEIAPKIECYVMALDYYKYQSFWDTSELPSPGQYAYDILFKTPGLSLNVMTATASQDMAFSLSTIAHFVQNSRFSDLFTPFFNHRFFHTNKLILWDVALSESIIYPDLSLIEKVKSPLGHHRVGVYKKIDAESLKTKFTTHLKNIFTS